MVIQSLAWFTLEYCRAYNERLNGISNTNYKKRKAEEECSVVQGLPNNSFFFWKML